MEIALYGLGVISLLEALLWLWPVWLVRRMMALVLILPLAVFSGLLVGAQPAIWTVAVLFVSVYRIINLLRVVESRPQVDYLQTSGWRASWWLIGVQLALYGVSRMQDHWRFSVAVWLGLLVASQFVGAAMLFLSTRRHLRTTRIRDAHLTVANRDLPTLTVAIPARNETDDLDACLRSLIASDYPKLEILVLDDCSQERRTPEIIRGFAHDGVRFIAGEVPPERWLAKNFAYQQLAAEANGDLILFCGVDVRFQSGTLNALVASLLERHKRMLSVAPHNEMPALRSINPYMLQPVRYAWEIALPRRFWRRPPVLSTCWLVEAQMLHQAGGFAAVSHTISPESYFAHWAVKHDDSYSFLHSDAEIGLICQKNLDEQRATTVRTRYPQLHRRPELVAGLSLLELAWLVAPFLLAVVALAGQAWILLGVSALNCLLLLSFYAAIINFTYGRSAWLSAWLLPLAAIYDLLLLNRSMWLYEFSEVIWKERNVCVPVMHITAN